MQFTAQKLLLSFNFVFLSILQIVSVGENRFDFFISKTFFKPSFPTQQTCFFLKYSERKWLSKNISFKRSLICQERLLLSEALLVQLSTSHETNTSQQIVKSQANIFSFVHTTISGNGCQKHTFPRLSHLSGTPPAIGNAVVTNTLKQV